MCKRRSRSPEEDSDLQMWIGIQLRTGTETGTGTRDWNQQRIGIPCSLTLKQILQTLNMQQFPWGIWGSARPRDDSTRLRAPAA